MSRRNVGAKRRTRLSIEPLEPRRLLDVSGVWQELGFRSASGGGLTYDGQDIISGDPAVAVAPDGQPVVAYECAGGIQVLKYDGQAWLSLGDLGTEMIPSSLGGRDPDIAVADTGEIYLTWLEGWNETADIHLSRGEYDPSTGAWTWSGIGGSTSYGGLSSDGVVNGAPAIALGIDNAPVVAYATYDQWQYDMDVVVKRYIPELNQWIELTSGPEITHYGGGGVSNDVMDSAGEQDSPQAVDIAVGGDDAPIVVWSTDGGSLASAQIYARRWNAVTSSWEKIGGQSASDPGEVVGGVSDTPGNAVEPRIAIQRDPDDSSRDIVMVAWRDYNDPQDSDYSAIYIKQLVDPNPETGSWAEVSPDSAEGGGIIGRDQYNYLSLAIGADGLPLIGVTRFEVAVDELAVDTTSPYSTANQVDDHGQVESNWYARALEAYDDGGVIAWRWLGESAEHGVTQARDTEIVELPGDGSDDGAPLLVFGEYVSGINWSADNIGGPYDPGYFPSGSVDPEVYAHMWDADGDEWVNYGEGSGDFGGLDNDIRWNSDPIVGTAEDGRVLVAFAERVGNEIYIRVRAYDDDLGQWVAFGTGLETGIPFDSTEVENYTYRWDEVVIGADPSIAAGADGRPVLAYLDYINTTDSGNADLYDHSSITAWSYDESAGAWVRLEPTGATGTDRYAYVSDGTVWDGYLIDQIDIIGAPDDGAYLAWRNVDPTFERDYGDQLVHIENLADGGREPFNEIQGASEIYLLQWNEGAKEWGTIGPQLSPFGAMPELTSMNFDPDLLLVPSGPTWDVWVAFTGGRMSEDGMLLGDIAVYEFITLNNAWTRRHSSILDASEEGQGYAHPKLALGPHGPVLAWEDQQWVLQSLADLDLLAYGNGVTSSDPNDRPLWDDNDGVNWYFDTPDAADPPYEEVEGGSSAMDVVFRDKDGFVVERDWAVIEGAFDNVLGFDLDRYVVTLPGYWNEGLFGIIAGEYGAGTQPYEDAGGGWLQVLITSYGGDVHYPGITVYEDTSFTTDQAETELEGPYELEVWAEYNPSGDLVLAFDIWCLGLSGDDVDYTVEVRWVVDTFVAEDQFQELTASSIRTAQYTTSWGSARQITPAEGYAYVLPDLTSGGGLEPVLTYTALELDNAGFPITKLAQWQLDLTSGTWNEAKVWYSVDLGLRSYFKGEYGGQGDGYTSLGSYSDYIASYFNPRIMYGSRHIDMEFAWWRTLGGWGTTRGTYTIIEGTGNIFPMLWQDLQTEWVFDDYYTPIPGDTIGDQITSPRSRWTMGWRVDGHVADTSYIYAMRYTPTGWEPINSQDLLGNTLPSDSDAGINALTTGLAWAPGFISSAGVCGVDLILGDAQPVVAWNYMEQNLIYVRQWSPETKLPELTVSETSGSTNDDRLEFGIMATGTEAYKTLVLQNTGLETLVIDEIAIGGSDAYSVTDMAGVPLDPSSDLPIVLESGQSTLIRVKASPDESGAMAGILYISTNDPLARNEVLNGSVSDNWYGIRLLGSAYTGADIAVTDPVAYPGVGIPDDLALPFGLVEVGSSQTRTVAITNNGTADLHVILEVHDIGQGFTLLGDAERTILPGETVDVQVRFDGNTFNQSGALGYLIVHHDDYGDATGFDSETDGTYIVTLVGNAPSLAAPTLVGAGSLPAASTDTLAYNTPGGGLSLYDMSTGELLATVETSGAGRARSDGIFTVYAKGGAIYLYDRVTQETVNLTEGLGVYGAANPNIEGQRVVFSAAASGGPDIHVIDLNVDANGHVLVGTPVVSHTAITDINPGAPLNDDYPDVSGDWVVWRRGNSDGEYTVYGKDLSTGQILLLSVGTAPGARLPRVSGNSVVWVEEDGGYRVMMYRFGEGGSELFRQQAELADEVAMSGDLLVWSDNRNGNFDLFGYFLPESGAGSASTVDVRERQFQLTFGPEDEMSPDVWGNWISWEQQAGSSSTLYYAALEAAGELHVEYAGAEVNDGDTLNLGTLWVDVDGTYVTSFLLEISNIGTGMLTVDDVIGQITGGNAELTVVLPANTLMHQGAEPVLVELILRATDDGPVTGTLEIQTNDPANPVLTLNLAAQADEPMLVFRNDVGGLLTSLSFGGVEAGQSVSVEFYVHNETANGVPLVLLDPVSDDPNITFELLLGQSDPGVTLNGSGNFVLDPGEYVCYRATWSPPWSVDSLGPMSATVTVASNDVESPTASLPATGVAYGVPYITVMDQYGTVSLGTLDFGDVLKGEYVDLGFMIRNDGLTDLTVFSIIIDDPTAFSFEPPLGSMPVLAPGEWTVLTVRFQPDDAATFTSPVRIVSNDAGNPLYEFTLEGDGYVVREITVLDGGTPLTSGTSVIQADPTAVVDVVTDGWSTVLTIRNDGELELNIGGWEILPDVGTPFGTFYLPPITDYDPSATVQLAYGQQIEVPLYFGPGATGEFSGTLLIYNDDADESPFTVTVQGEGIAPDIDLSTTSHNFGTIQIDETASAPIVITNNGQADLTLSSWTSSNPAVFSIDPANPVGPDGDVVLAPGGSTTVFVTFSPAGMGTQSATLTFNSDDPDEPAQQVTVSGRAVAGNIVILETAGVSNDDIVDFGNVVVGEPSTVDVVVRNTGQGTLTLASWVSGSPAFALSPDTPPGALAPGASTTLQVIFTPPALGTITSQVVINSDDPDEPAYVLTVTGTAVAGDVAVTEQSGTVGDDRLEFGNVAVGGQWSQSFTLRNEGVGELTITGWEIVYTASGQDLGAYALELAAGTVLMPGQGRPISVTFAPTQSGDHDAILRIFSNDPDEPVYEIDLSAQGVAPSLVVLENSGQQANDDLIAFGQVKVGQTATVLVTLLNDGEIPLELTGWSTTNGAFTLDPANLGGVVLQPGQTTQVTLEYTPAAIGAGAGEIRINSNDPQRPAYVLDVTGAGVVPTITVTESSGTPNDDVLEFGDVVVGQTAHRQVVVQNNGVAPLRLSAHETTNYVFSVLPENGASAGDDLIVQPGSSVTLDVAFTPSWQLTEIGTITLVSDAANGSRYEIAVSGRGVPEPVPGDFNGDGSTDMGDFWMLEAAFGSRQGDAAYNPMFDLAGPDGVIDFADLAMFATTYGQTNGATTESVAAESRVPGQVAGGGQTSSPVVASSGASGKTRFVAPVTGQAEEEGSASSGLFAVSGQVAEDRVIFENLSAAFDMGALPTGLAGSIGQTVTVETGTASVAIGSVEGETKIEVEQAIEMGEDGASGPTQPLADNLSVTPLAMPLAQTDSADPLGVDALSQIDASVAPYAAALLPL